MTYLPRNAARICLCRNAVASCQRRATSSANPSVAAQSNVVSTTLVPFRQYSRPASRSARKRPTP
jgi:hypothetical protein